MTEKGSSPISGECKELAASAQFTAAPQALRIVHHEKKRPHRDPTFASSTVPRQAAGRVHRRGLDGPSMQNPL